MRCTECGSRPRAGAVFCDECGRPLSGPETGAPRSPVTVDRSASLPDAPEIPSPADPVLAPDYLADPSDSRVAVPTHLRAATAEPESVGGGRYRIKRLVGEGATKKVYLADDLRLGREVAVSLISVDQMNEESRHRVQREARAMARLGDHPNIVTVYDVGEESGRPYLVSEIMRGGELADEIGEGLPLERVLTIGKEIASALEHAHAQGIFHRDLKPGNVWMTESGEAKLGDFGLAVRTDSLRVTKSGVIVGSVAYLAPECATGGGLEADARSDLYSLGVLLFEAATGRVPFEGDVRAVVSQHINTPPPAPSRLRPDLPKVFDSLVLSLLAKAPSDRPQSATEVRTAIETLLDTMESGSSAEAVGLASGPDRAPLIGRNEELGQLRSAIEDAAAGQGSVVVIAGEPGIGKTRLWEESASYAELRGAEVLVGTCYEGEGAPAYWPWVQVLRELVSQRSDAQLRSDLGGAVGEVAQIVPEVATRFPDTEAPPSIEPEQARFRLFDGITSFLKRASASKPLLVVLDDIHWADEASLLLLRFIAKESSGTRIAVVCTYRDTELDRKHPLADTLAALARERSTRRLVLGRMSRDDVAEFAKATAGGQVSETVIDLVFGETEGNPFFVQEVIRLLSSEGQLTASDQQGPSAEGPGRTSPGLTLPQSVREVVAMRLNRMREEAFPILAIGAVVGRDFDLKIVEMVSQEDPELIFDVLDEATAAKVIEEDPARAGQYRFTSNLIRESLLDDLSATRRARLHLKVANALEELHSGNLTPWLAQLADHYAKAGVPEKATDYAIRASVGATKSLAYEEAVRLLRTGLEAAEQLPRSKASLRCEVLLSLGAALDRAGIPDEARDVYRRAADVARESRLVDEFGRAVLGVGGLMGEIGIIDRELVSLFEEALTMLGDSDSTTAALVLSRASLAYAYSDEEKGLKAEPGVRRVALDHADRAVEMAERIGDPGTLAYCLFDRLFAIPGPQFLEQRSRDAERIIELAEQAGDVDAITRGRSWRISGLLEKALRDDAERELGLANEMAETMQHPLGLWYVSLVRGMFAVLDGDFSLAEKLAAEALNYGNRGAVASPMQIYSAQLAIIRFVQGRLSELEGIVSSYADQYPTMPAWRSVLAYIQVEKGDVDAARDEFERLASNDFQDLPQDFNLLITLTAAAWTCSVLGDTARARLIYDMMAPYSERVIVAGSGAACIGAAALYLGLLAKTMGRFEEAEAHFEKALALNSAIRARPFVALTRSEFGFMLAERKESARGVDDAERARAMLNEALDTFEELEMGNAADRTRLRLEQIWT